MLKNKLIIVSIDDVPNFWIFEHYLKLSEKLQGQDVTIKSVFSSNDYFPSMFIHYDKSTGKYIFNDFSSGLKGGAVDLVRYLFNIDFKEAYFKIINDYKHFIQNNKVGYEEVEVKHYSKFIVSDYEIREWNNLDYNYWKKYFISSEKLEEYCIYPLAYYKLEKVEDGVNIFKNVQREYIYGYFRKDGTLHKIYQPFVLDCKFFKVSQYIQGSEQLKFESDYLIINSSMKDLISFDILNINNTETIAPDSENVLIPKDYISFYTKKYKKIFTIFDNDEAGKKAVIKYKEVYGIDGITLDTEKDVADSVKNLGIEKTRLEIYNKLKLLL